MNCEMLIPAAVDSFSEPSWADLPDDITANILQRLSDVEILENAYNVCTSWRRVCQDPSMWRVIHLYGPRTRRTMTRRLARRAVDLSCGELVAVRIDYFGDDELLSYIADRSSNLKYLTLDRCRMISGEALVAAVMKLPQLKELHLRSMTFRPSHIGAIGTACPALRAFTSDNDLPISEVLRNQNLRDEEDGVIYLDDYAIAIAATMPNLVHLRLYGHWMENDGLWVILAGCPLIETLDIRGCSNLDLRGDLGIRCSWIKDLRRDPDREDESDSEDSGYDSFEYY